MGVYCIYIYLYKYIYALEYTPKTYPSILYLLLLTIFLITSYFFLFFRLPPILLLFVVWPYFLDSVRSWRFIPILDILYVVSGKFLLFFSFLFISFQSNNILHYILHYSFFLAYNIIYL